MYLNIRGLPDSLFIYVFLYYNQVYQYFVLATVYMHIYLFSNDFLNFLNQAFFENIIICSSSSSSPTSIFLTHSQHTPMVRTFKWLNVKAYRMLACCLTDHV